MPNPPSPPLTSKAIRRFIPTRTSRLRMLAHTRHIVLVTLPLGAGTGFLVAMALKGLGSFEPMIMREGGRTGLTILLPAIGLFFTTAWLKWNSSATRSASSTLEATPKTGIGIP